MSSPSYAKVATLIETALTMTEERLASTPPGSVQAMFGSIRNQLVFMRDTVAAGHPATVEQRNSLTLGVIAVREFETSDVTYCDAICDAVYQFKKLT